MIVIEPYNATCKQEWDEFVRRSKNGTFLFCRDYMDYHQDRFHDASWVIRDADGQLLSLVPANRNDNTLVSHGGLTYGGVVTDGRMTASVMFRALEALLRKLRENGYGRLMYKAVPHIYHRHPSEEDLYALFRVGARMYRRDVTTVATPGRLPFQERRTRAIKKAQRAGVVCSESDLYAEFWAILEWNLRTVHNLNPVHTVEEILRLRSAFPDEIKLFGAFVDGKLVAGTVIYDTATVAHAQYTASSDAGRASGALDLLFSYLVQHVYAQKPYFDFGVSTESSGQHLNTGLVEYKEGFGGRTITHDFYELDL